MCHPGPHFAHGMDNLVSTDFVKDSAVQVIVGPGYHIPNPQLLQKNCRQHAVLYIRSHGYYSHVELVNAQFPQNSLIGGICLNSARYMRRNCLDSLLISIQGQYVISHAQQGSGQTDPKASQTYNHYLLCHLRLLSNSHISLRISVCTWLLALDKRQCQSQRAESSSKHSKSDDQLASQRQARGYPR